MTDPTRRDVLAGLGTAAVATVAGCNRLQDESDAPTRFDADDVRTVLSTSTPEFQRPVPVQPDGEAIEQGLTRCTDLVETVPSSISTEEVPNGAVRREISQYRADAVEARGDVEDESEPFHALLSLREARATALRAAAAFQAIQNDLASSLERAQRELRTRVGTRLVQVEYTGDDRGRTLLLAFRLERALLGARRRVNRGFRTPDPNVLDVGDLADDVEHAAATLDATEALTARHDAETTEPTDFTNAIGTTLRATELSIGRSDPPDPDASERELFGRPLERRELQYLSQNALRSADRWREDLATARTEGRFAIGLDHAFRAERDARAFETVARRIEEDTIPELETVEPIRTEREAALEAARSVPVEPAEPSLAGDVLARSGQQLTWLDQELKRHVDGDSETTLQREYARYIYLRAQLEALPDTIDAIRGRLDAWDSDAFDG